MYKLAVFDFDSTLMDGETIEFIADEIGLRKEIATITQKAMEGDMDFFESLTLRVSYLKGIPESKVDTICKNLPYVQGAKETIQELQKAGIKVVCFSGGFKNALIPAQEYLGLNGAFYNILHSKNSVLTGFVGGEMMFNDSKGIMLQKLQTILQISPKETIAIGDGANDISMFHHAQERIAFCAKPILKQASTISIEEKNLIKILDAIKL
ncbi:MAG: phosphoserine phosphatase SerB [Candidatus Gastranaerophilales bacterium]|nr:phosphoserine phosphatase SerB [Candidatus Gastranaerophilales bacterium]